MSEGKVFAKLNDAYADAINRSAIPEAKHINDERYEFVYELYRGTCEERRNYLEGLKNKGKEPDQLIVGQFGGVIKGYYDVLEKINAVHEKLIDMLYQRKTGGENV